MFRWAEVTEELRQALSEVDEEKEKRKRVEEEMNLKAQEQDNLKNKFSALMEEREKEKAAMFEKEAAENLLLAPDTFQSEESDKVVGELENEAKLQSLQKQQVLLVSSLHDMKQKGDKPRQELRDVSQMQTLQVSLNNKVCVNSLLRI